MSVRSRISGFFTAASAVIYGLAAVLFLCVLIHTAWSDLRHVWLYYFFSSGAAAVFLLMLLPRFRHNLRWWMKFTHELTHTLVALLFFRKISTFVVREKECYVAYSGGWFGYVPITLSPYCVPLYTLMILPFRYAANIEFMQIFDFLLGFTYMFHIMSFCVQFNFRQSDIINCGKVRSTFFIAFMQFFFASLVIETIRGGVWNALKRVVCTYPAEILASLYSSLPF